MTTGVIAVLGVSAAISYTAPVDAKLQINACTNGGNAYVSLNGTPVLSVPASGNASMSLFIGIGQTVTISNGTTVSSVVTVLEGT